MKANDANATKVPAATSDGTRYRATVPDTLDLAEQARLAINALTGHLEPKKNYAVYQSFTFAANPQLGGLTWNLPAKDARVLPMLRAMAGSTQNMDIESGLMRALLAQIGKDGLAYSPIVCDGVKSFCYINGEEKSTGSSSSKFLPNMNLPFRLGQGYSEKRFFKGLLSDVRIYRMALSPAEVQAVMKE